ncbi:M15 family metallopeptidase [Shewanella sp. AS1]|uniref:M15 family metallopeptidase n=1 Tax=Shewanella sp. AS1 TaxID=2907626 RepID=UPI001F439DC1|nr:M15 family metallopeptidase [Shewanella sp. AS1]MCE9678770.1 M15 family metallopeptidase [Shewanella sp. AS1]
MLINQPAALVSQVYGLETPPLVEYQGHLLEPETAGQLKKMQHKAEQDGISIQICSAYRSFAKQLAIWNAKAEGQRTLLDKNSQSINHHGLSQDELIDTILLWSALPGISRHHWGTDIDLFDANQINQSQLRLVAQEYAPGGPCHAMYLWLQHHGKEFGFYFPYQAGLSAVSPEPWHLSYYPKAKDYLDAFELETLRQILTGQQMALKTAVLNRLPSLVKAFAYRIAPWPAI